MEKVGRAHTSCDECGGEMVKAVALHDGKAFCMRCWKKLFSPVPCSDCQSMTYSYRGQTPATCKKCRSKGRTCLDCNREIEPKRIGKLLPEGALCDRCVRKRNAQEQACPNCGHVTKHLAMDRSAGFDVPVCSTCRHRAKKDVVCSHCGKRRRAYCHVDGQPVCFSCSKEKELAAETGTPQEIVNQNRLNRQADFLQLVREAAAKLRSNPMRNLFEAIILERYSHNPYETRDRFSSYLQFFATLEKNFPFGAGIKVADFVKIFPGGEFRRHKIFYHYLVERGAVINHSEEELREQLDKQRHLNILAKAKGTWFEKILREFLERQYAVQERYRKRGWTGKHIRFVNSSICNSLMAALRFLETLPANYSYTSIAQEEFDNFLGVYPGHRHSINAFLRFIRLHRRAFHADKIELPKEKSLVNFDDILPEPKRKELLSSWLNPSDEGLRDAFIGILMLLYAQKRKKLVALKRTSIVREKDNSLKIILNRVPLPLPERVISVVERYLVMREQKINGPNDYLFPGLLPGSHMDETNVDERMAIYGVGPKQLYVTSLLRLYSHGLSHPSVTRKGLGVSNHTSVKYFKCFDDRIMKEVNRVIE